MTVSYDAPLRADSVDDTVTFEAADPRPNPEAEMLAGVLPENLEHSLNQLTPDQRRLITLADIEQLPYDEISRLIGAPRAYSCAFFLASSTLMPSPALNCTFCASEWL